MAETFAAVRAVIGAGVDVGRLVVDLVGRGWLLAFSAVLVVLLFGAAVLAVRAISRELSALDNDR